MLFVKSTFIEKPPVPCHSRASHSHLPTLGLKVYCTVRIQLSRRKQWNYRGTTGEVPPFTHPLPAGMEVVSENYWENIHNPLLPTRQKVKDIEATENSFLAQYHMGLTKLEGGDGSTLHLGQLAVLAVTPPVSSLLLILYYSIIIPVCMSYNVLVLVYKLLSYTLGLLFHSLLPSPATSSHNPFPFLFPLLLRWHPALLLFPSFNITHCNGCVVCH